MRPAQISDLGGGVHRVTLPLPWALDHVHCYAIADADGWTLVDAGLGTPGTRARWQEALAALGAPRVRRIVLTHYHPDHVGASAALQELTGAEEVVQGAHDARQSRRAWIDERDGDGFRRHLVRHGMPAELAQASSDAERDVPVEPARPTRLVEAGDTVEIAGERYAVLVLPGHADGHVALLGERSGRLFGGDVLLDEITPNVGRWNDSRPDPLGHYLATLDVLGELAPATVFPGHRRPIEDAAGRAAEIRAHHAARLDAHEQALGAGASTPYEVAVHVFGAGLGFHERRFALAEALAHLERLAGLGRAEQLPDGGWRAVA